MSGTEAPGDKFDEAKGIPWFKNQLREFAKDTELDQLASTAFDLFVAKNSALADDELEIKPEQIIEELTKNMQKLKKPSMQ